jgi:hypothetical protein
MVAVLVAICILLYCKLLVEGSKLFLDGPEAMELLTAQSILTLKRLLSTVQMELAIGLG